MTTERKTFWKSKGNKKRINIEEVTYSDNSEVKIITSVTNMDPDREIFTGNYSQARFDCGRLMVSTEWRNMDGKDVFAEIEVVLTPAEMRRLAVQLVNNIDVVEPCQIQ